MSANKLNPQGIDYAGRFSAVNRDANTGIRYGVISTGSLTEWFWESVENDYGQATCPKCGNPTSETTAETAESREDYEQYRSRGCDDYACDECHLLLSSDDCFSDESSGWSIDDGTIKAINCLDSDTMVIASPYYTYAKFCSPCVPGACSMDSSLDLGDVDATTAKSYCFGHDWFDGGQAPYPVYSVESGKQVIAQLETTPCPNCHGSGRDTVRRLATVRQSTQDFTRQQIDNGAINVRDYDGADTFLCFRCDGKGTQSEMVEHEVQS